VKTYHRKPHTGSEEEERGATHPRCATTHRRRWVFLTFLVNYLIWSGRPAAFHTSRAAGGAVVHDGSSPSWVGMSCCKATFLATFRATILNSVRHPDWPDLFSSFSSVDSPFRGSFCTCAIVASGCVCVQPFFEPFSILEMIFRRILQRCSIVKITQLRNKAGAKSSYTGLVFRYLNSGSVRALDLECLL
jgi:hypothetical protein